MMTDEKHQPPDWGPDDVWQYRGYRLRPNEFVTAMVHFYRGEVTRSNVWRTRLDNTINWAVVTTAAILTFAFGSPSHTHVVILMSLLMVLIFLVIESRRYRYYELWALRVRLMETDFFAAMLQPPFHPHREWAARLADTLLTPEFPISFWEAIGRRLRRNYIWVFAILGIAWIAKLALHPSLEGPGYSLVDQARVGPIPGPTVFMAVALFYGGILLLAFFTAGLRASPGEVLSHQEVLGVPTGFLQNLAKAASELPLIHRREHLAIVVTERPREVGSQLMSMLKRGVTAVEGTGMYSGSPRSVLFCAVSAGEIERVKSAVYSVDESAFLVVNPTEEVWGAGFRDLKPRWLRSRRKQQPPTGGKPD